MIRPIFLQTMMFLGAAIASQSIVIAGIQIANFSDNTNDRFTNSSSFIGAGLDFSGVGRTTDNGRWGTLISSNAVLTANHFRPSVSSTFEFYSGNDSSAGAFEAIVTGGQRVGSTDLYISFLDRNVDPSIAVYDFNTEFLFGDPNPGSPINAVSAGSAQNQRAFIFGVSPTGRSALATDQAVGENIISGFDENVVFGSGTDVDTLILVNDAAGSPNFLTHEAFVQGGDSGAPVFIESGGDLLLLGTNSFQLNSDPPGTFQATGISHTGNQTSTISSILSANVIAVPEPNSIMLIALMVLGLVNRRRRIQGNC